MTKNQTILCKEIAKFYRFNQKDYKQLVLDESGYSSIEDTKYKELNYTMGGKDADKITFLHSELSYKGVDILLDFNKFKKIELISVMDIHPRVIFNLGSWIMVGTNVLPIGFIEKTSICLRGQDDHHDILYQFFKLKDFLPPPVARD